MLEILPKLARIVPPQLSEIILSNVQRIHGDTEVREFMKNLMIANPTEITNEDALSLIDDIIGTNREKKPRVDLDEQVDLICALKQDDIGPRVMLWRGDITTQKVDVIVNAANGGGLGCFVPRHVCVDNKIHRAAGPRLREACRSEMRKLKGKQLKTVPIVTSSFGNLQSRYVFHVTGPNIQEGFEPTTFDKNELKDCYINCLEKAKELGVQSIAFCSISTGLYSFPKEMAGEIVIQTIKDWIERNLYSCGNLNSICFTVYDAKNEGVYRKLLHTYFPRCDERSVCLIERNISIAKHLIDSADCFIISAGAGMSVKEDRYEENVYVDPIHFKKHYPEMLKYGYKIAYEAIGLLTDRQVPIQDKWTFWAKHMRNMRYSFQPNDGYSFIKNIVGNKDYFIFTSNVDGCFLRSGFDSKRIYRPQGDWEHYQCIKPCRPDAVFPSKPKLDELLLLLDKNGKLKESEVPKCQFCSGDTFGNVRGGEWFLEIAQETEKEAFRSFLKENRNKKVVVIEVGAGYNTPGVLRYSMEHYIRGTQDGKLIRINPDEHDCQVPQDLLNSNKGVTITAGWQALKLLK